MFKYLVLGIVLLIATIPAWAAEPKAAAKPAPAKEAEPAKKAEATEKADGAVKAEPEGTKKADVAAEAEPAVIPPMPEDLMIATHARRMTEIELDEETRRIVQQQAAHRRTELCPVERGVHGAWNMVIAPLELPATMLSESRIRDNAIKGVLWGGAGGIANFAVREIAGMAEVFTMLSFQKSEPLYDRKLGEPATLPMPWQ